MVAQGVLPFQYEADRSGGSVTALAGLPAFFELAVVAGLRESVERHVGVRVAGQGWTDWEMVSGAVLLNIAGGDCPEDFERLEADEGLGRVMRQLRTAGLGRNERRALERRWRKECERSFASPSAVRRYLLGFHDASEEQRRAEVMAAVAEAEAKGCRAVKGRAFIPERLPALLGLSRVNADLLAFVQQHHPVTMATLDMDATLIGTHKAQALVCYKHFRAYQPLNVWWAEQQLVAHSEFRDGNVPAGFEQLRVFVESLSYLPVGIVLVRMRSDTAGYQWELLRYCEEGRNERFGRIEFVVGVDITEDFKLAALATPGLRWNDLGTTGQQWAEVCFVPDELGRTKRGHYRFIAIREPVRQQELFGDARQYSFPTLEGADSQGRRQVWKLTAVVTNRKEAEASAPEIIQWYRDRCGKSEEAHAVMKRDLAGGHLPSGAFGCDAAWWLLMILSLNLVATFKRLLLDACWLNKRMKALRFWLVAVPARVIDHARRFILRLAGESQSADLLIEARERICALANLPSG